MNTSIAGPIARILLRYGGMALVAVGAMREKTAETLIADPDIQMVAGAIVMVIVEGWYVQAKRKGGPT